MPNYESEEVKSLRKQIQHENEIRKAYRTIFKDAGKGSELLMEDLERLCFFNEPTYTGKGDNAVEDSINRDGMRAVLLHIKTMSSAKPIDEDQMVEQMLAQKESEE